MSLFTDLQSAGIPIDNHYSDLYFPLTPESRAILRKHPLQAPMATLFTSQTDGKLWVDVPLAFDPYWEKRL